MSQITVDNPTLDGSTSPAFIASASSLPNPISAPASNLNNGVNDISDIRPTPQPSPLPIRAETRILPVGNTAQEIQTEFDNAWASIGVTNAQEYQNVAVGSEDFYTTAAKKTFTDFVKIRLPHRGVNPSTMKPDPTQAVEYKFLINPKTFSINRQTVDVQSLTRGGWQFGVWGEDMFTVSMSGQSAGSYFTLGTTDQYSYYSVSYRNLMQLQQLFQNNGYWFEGEETNEGPLAANYLRRRIKMHQDIELTVGNFIWYGMFDSMGLSQEATRPFTINFNLTFLVWKERFRSTSPYNNSIQNDIQGGQSYSAVMGQQQTTNTTTTQVNTPSLVSQTNQFNNAINEGASSMYAGVDAVKSATADDQAPTIDSSTSDVIGFTPMNNLINFKAGFWGTPPIVSGPGPES